MSEATTIAILIILLLLSGFTIIVNTFTEFVFWIHRIKVKRTFLLVINLTVADLLVGIAPTVFLGLIISKSDYIWILNIIFGRTNFSVTGLRFDLAASTSCNKHQGLHLQCGYRLVRWDTNWCFQFANRVWDFFCYQFCNRLLGRHCFVVIYHLLVLSVNPQKTLQPKSCFR